MAPQIADNENAPDLDEWLRSIPGIPADMVEAQLGHGKSGPLGSAYDRAEYMGQRRQMMQTWADYLDRLRKGGEVITLSEHRS